MGNALGSLFSGFAQLFDKILGHPLDFLSGKTCNSACRPTWDLVCYIENFCVSHLLKLAFVAVLVYFVLLFLYLVYKLGICQCFCRVIFRAISACCSAYFSAIHCCCSFLCLKLRSVKRSPRRRRRDSAAESGGSEEEYDYEPEGSFRNSRFSRRRKDYREERIRKSLRPRSHRPRLDISSQRRRNPPDAINGDNTSPLHHHIRVARSSKLSLKGSRQIHRRR